MGMMQTYSWSGSVGKNEDSGTNATTATRPTVDMNITAADTWTGYSELFSSTDFEARGFSIYWNCNNALSNVMYEIAIGAASSEINIIDTYLFWTDADSGNFAYFDLNIPKGSRVSVRSRSWGGNTDTQIGLQLHPKNMSDEQGFYKATTYGATADGTDTIGTLLTASATANTKGSYAELTSSTSRPIKAVNIACSKGNDNTSTNAEEFLVDLAIGAASSELVVIPNIHVHPSSQEGSGVYIGNKITYPLQIPSGTRLSARCQCATGSQVMDIIVVGYE